MRWFLVLSLIGSLVAADPYLPWSQGRPAEAAPLLTERARSLDTWPSWNDAGLAWAEAGDRGLAAACLLRAHQLAPGATAPRTALGLVADGTPNAWSNRLGPFAALGRGWAAVVLAGLAGLGLGWAAAGRGRRSTALAIGLVSLALVAPGAIADLRDRSRDLAVTLRETDLVNASGDAIQSLPAGTVLQVEAGTSWGGRLRVATADGTGGYLGRFDLALARDPESIPSAAR